MRVQTTTRTAILTTFALFSAAQSARALTTPDTGTCNSTSSTGCLKISNTSTTSGTALQGAVSGTGIAVWGVATAGGTGIQGSATSGKGVVAASGSGIGLYAGSNTGYGIYSRSVSSFGIRGDSTSSDGIYGLSASNTSSGVIGLNSGDGVGIKGSVSLVKNGTAVYGDAGNSGSAWAGQFIGDVNVTGFYYVNGSALSTSDARLKEEVKDMSHGLAQLLKLRPVTFKWKDGKKNKGTQLGLIAQEVREVVPEVVQTNRASGMLAIEYGALIPITIRAIKQQQEVIQRQEQLLQRQQKQLEEQEARIAALEQRRTTVSSFP